jgi:hypothetical protein
VIDPDALARGMFLLAAFSLSGWLQTRWLPGSALESLRVPLDAGLRIRGRRLFGAIKTLRGLVVMVPASGLTCLGLGAALSLAPRAADHLSYTRIAYPSPTANCQLGPLTLSLRRR